MSVKDVESRLVRVRDLIHARSMVWILIGESVDDLVLKNLEQLVEQLGRYEKIEALLTCIEKKTPENFPPDLKSEYIEDLSEMLVIGEDETYSTLEMLEDQTCLLGESKNLGALEVIEDLNEATEVFKRRIRRKMNRGKRDKADEVEGASVA